MAPDDLALPGHACLTVLASAVGPLLPALVVPVPPGAEPATAPA